MSDYPPLRWSVPPAQHPKPPEKAVPILYSELQRVLTFLPRNRFAYLFKRQVGRAEPGPGGIAVDSEHVLRLALFDWFAHLGEYVSDDQQQRIVEQFAAQLDNAVLPDGMTAAIQGRMLTLTDGRYAAVTGLDHWYDYELDETRVDLPEPGVTHIACDLVALQLRVRKRVAELRGGKDAAAKRSDGGPRRAADDRR